jgi:hypothetical protein
MKPLKFETIYRNQRQYVLSCLAGSKLNNQGEVDTNAVSFRRTVYQSLRQEVQMQFNQNVDRNAWVFDQNELKTRHTGKQTLKALCLDYFVELESSSEPMFMNPETGSLDTHDGWNYINEQGQEVNAVDLGEVYEVFRNSDGAKKYYR